MWGYFLLWANVWAPSWMWACLFSCIRVTILWRLRLWMTCVSEGVDWEHLTVYICIPVRENVWAWSFDWMHVGACLCERVNVSVCECKCICVVECESIFVFEFVNIWCAEWMCTSMQVRISVCNSLCVRRFRGKSNFLAVNLHTYNEHVCVLICINKFISMWMQVSIMLSSQSVSLFFKWSHKWVNIFE